MNQILIKEREMAGFTKAYVAKYLGISGPMYAMMEKGVRGVSSASSERLGELYQKDASEFRTKALIGDGNMAPLPNAPPSQDVLESESTDQEQESSEDQIIEPPLPYIEEEYNPEDDEFSEMTDEEREVAEKELDKLLGSTPQNVTLDPPPPPVEEEDEQPVQRKIDNDNVVFGDVRPDDWVTKIASRIDVGEGKALRSHGVFDSAGQFFEGLSIGPNEQCLIKTGVKRANKYEGSTVAPLPELLLRSELWICPTPIWLDDELCVVAYAHATCLVERGMPIAMLV